MAEKAAQVQGIKLAEPGFWGPLSPEMVARISVDPKWIIDPFNLDPPSDGWLFGPKYSTDRGMSVRIKGNPIWLYVGESNFYALVGRGPNETMELTREHFEALERVETALHRGSQAWEEIIALCYDVTNGTISGGDIFRIEPKPGSDGEGKRAF